MSNKNMVGNTIDYWEDPSYKHKDFKREGRTPESYRRKGSVVDEWADSHDTKQYLVQPDGEDEPVKVIPLRSIHRVLFFLLLALFVGLALQGCHAENRGISEVYEERRQYLEKELLYESMLDDTDLPGFFHVFFEEFTGDTVYLEVTYTVDEDVVNYTLSAGEWSTRPDTLVQPLAARLIRLYEQCK